MPTKSFDTEGHGVAESRQNRVAGRIMLRARQSADLTQTEMAAQVAKRLGMPSMGQATLSGWEISIRAVPAAALIAAAEIARARGFDLSELINAELGPATIPQAARLAAALESIANALTGEASEQVREAASTIRAKRR